MTSSKILPALWVAFLVLVAHGVAGQQAPSGSQRSRPSNAAPSDLRTVHRTIYTGKTEMFITFRPSFFVGQPTRVGAHLSKLGGDRFLPYADAGVTLTLTVDGVAVKATATKPDRPGVFRLELTPMQTGMGSLVVEIAGGDGADTLVLDNVPVYRDHADALAHQGPDPDAGAIKYSKERSWDENEYVSAPVARVQLDGSSPARRVLAVPRTAIVQVDGAPRVYVQRNPEAFDLTEVRTGRSNATYVEITQGLREGDRIVIKGGDKMPRK